MRKTIEVCGGYNCTEDGSDDLRKRLEKLCKKLDFEVVEKGCTGHCSKCPVVCIDGDIYSGNDDIFSKSNRKLKNWLKNYESSTGIEGYCGSAEGRDCGLAVDIGTTVIKASLVDLESGDLVGKVSTINKQTAYGSTVLHRWNYMNKADDREEKLGHLNEIVRQSVDDIGAYFAEESGANITKTVLAGNSAMTYFFLNKDPCLTLDEKPEYTALKQEDNNVLLPCIFEWVGGDIVSGMAYLDFDSFDRNVMLIDLGTNGEVALSTTDGIILVASASAGPAFEGEGFRYGMPAMNGAINKVWTENDELKYNVMGQDEPTGLCGSGMLDLIAEMLANGVMDRSGTLDDEYGKEFTLTGDISVLQREITYFKESKAAIFATVQTLLSIAQLSLNELDTIYVAGGFGNMDLEKAQFIGLLPQFDNYRFMGNTSLAGAQLCLDDENIVRAELIAASSTPFTLTDNDTWMDHYMASMFFPHTDISLFDDILKKFMKN